MKKYFHVCFVLLASVLLSSCAYHIGAPLNRSYSSIALADISNLTREANLTQLMKDAILNKMAQEPYLNLKNQNEADLIVTLKLSTYGTSSYTSSQKRHHRELDNEEQNSYATTVRRLELWVEYKVYKQGCNDKPLFEGKVSGEGFIPTIHDNEIAWGPALRAATDNAAEKIMTAILCFEE